MQRVCPVLHSDPRTEGVVEICDVTGPVDVGMRGLQRGINEHAVVHRESSRLGETDLGRRTNTDQHDISGQFVAGLGPHGANSIGVAGSRE